MKAKQITALHCTVCAAQLVLYLRVAVLCLCQAFSSVPGWPHVKGIWS